MIAELLAELLSLYLDIKFWFKKRKRRKFEKVHNLPKKTMLYPSQIIGVICLAMMLFLVAVFGLVRFPNIKLNRTQDELLKITGLLAKEKKDMGVYPKKLKAIIRNNPLLKNIIRDPWDTEYSYVLSEDGLSYRLFSFGNDKTPHTEDDIILKP